MMIWIFRMQMKLLLVMDAELHYKANFGIWVVMDLNFKNKYISD